MVITEREARNLGDLVVRVAVIPLLATALLLASPGAAFAQSVGEDQYTNADPGQQQGEYTNAVPSQDQSGGTQQAPVGPGDPANPGSTSQTPVPGSTSQTPETFEQALTGILTDLNSISQSLAALSQSTTPVAAQDANAALAVPTAPANVLVGGTGTVPVPVTSAPTAVVPASSPGQPPVAMVNPLSTAINAASINVMPTGGGMGEGIGPANAPFMTVGGGIGHDLPAPYTVDMYGNECADPYPGSSTCLPPADGTPPGEQTVGGGIGHDLPAPYTIDGPDKSTPPNLKAAIEGLPKLLGSVLPKPQKQTNWMYNDLKDGKKPGGGPAPEEADPSGEFNPTETKDPVTGE